MSLCLEPTLQLQLEAVAPDVKVVPHVLEHKQQMQGRAVLMDIHLQLVAICDAVGFPHRLAAVWGVGYLPFAKPNERCNQMLTETRHEMHLLGVNLVHCY